MEFPNRRGLTAVLMIAPFFLWGTAMVAMKGVTLATPPLFMAMVRLLPAGLLVLLWAAWQRRPGPVGWRAWAWITLFALVDGTLFQGFLAEGLQRTGAGLGSVMIDSQPLLVAVLARLLFGERIGLWGALGLGLGLVGISLLALPPEWVATGLAQALHALGLLAEAPAQSLADLLPSGSWGVALFNNGQWLMLLASVSMAIGTVISRYVSRHVDAVVATGWHMVIGGLPLLLGSLTLEGQPWRTLGWADWGALGYATVFGSAIAYALFFWFASRGSLTSFTALTFLTPVFALLFGSWLLGESLGSLQWLGVGLSLVSITLINQREALARGFAAREGLPDESPLGQE